MMDGCCCCFSLVNDDDEDYDDDRDDGQEEWKQFITLTFNNYFKFFIIQVILIKIIAIIHIYIHN